MNKKGQQVLVGVFIAAALFILVVSLIEPLKDTAETTHNTLDCDNSTLTAGQSGTCIVTDSYMFLWVGASLMAIIGLIKVGQKVSGG